MPVRLGFVLKTRLSSTLLLSLEIPNLPDSPLCPVRTLKAYLEATKQTSESALVLDPSGGKSLNAATLAHCLAKTIQWLLPGCKAKAHDTRRLSTTHASMAGVSAQSIIDAGS